MLYISIVCSSQQLGQRVISTSLTVKKTWTLAGTKIGGKTTSITSKLDTFVENVDMVPSLEIAECFWTMQKRTATSTEHQMPSLSPQSVQIRMSEI